MVDRRKLVQTGQAYSELDQQEIERQHREHRDEHRHLDGEHHPETERHVQDGERLDERERERKECQQTLWQRLEPEAVTFEQHLKEALRPPSALLHELTNRRRRLFARDIAVVVQDSDWYAESAQADTDVSVLGQAALIPAA